MQKPFQTLVTVMHLSGLTEIDFPINSNTVNLAISNHSKCEDLVVACFKSPKKNQYQIPPSRDNT